MTELVWDGKYSNGKKNSPIRIALPFQTIETINESAEDRKKNLDLFTNKKETEWRNRLIWGDKKYVLPSLLPEFAGKVNLIYIDPPFNVGADFSFTATIPDNPETDDDETTTFVKQPSLIEQKAYRDTWGKGLDSYLQWFYETAILLRELLAEDGSIYVHLDWHVGHYAKVVLDEVFGYDNFLNHITWKRSTPRGNSYRRYPELTDYILIYTKNETHTWNEQFGSYRQEYIDKYYSYIDEKSGRKFQPTSILGHSGINPIYEWKGLKKPWRYPKHRLDELDSKNLLYWPSKGEVPRLKRYLDEQKGMPIQSLWEDIPPVNSQATEDTKYDTQKPEALLERIIKASSNENDIVLDCFCGSGTTAAVAEKLNRKWITCDLGRFAIHTTRKRLLQINNLKPFVVQNLGKYERQAWVTAEFDNAEDRAIQEKIYRNFIVDLYHGIPVNSYVWLHGIKAGRMIHIGSVDAPVSLGDIKAAIQEFWKTVGTPMEPALAKDGIKGGLKERVNGIDILGWEFAFDINETAAQHAAVNKVDIKFKKIPREVLEKKAVEQGDIHFFELAALSVKTKIKAKELELTLKDFIIPPDDVPEDVRSAITHWSQWIDYWAVDWNYKDDTFHNEWQSYRTKKDPAIELSVTHKYEDKGSFTVLVKVIDILGNDTTKVLNVEIK